MNNNKIYKNIRVTQNKVGQWDSGFWLRRIGMDVLTSAMVMLSAEYGLKWADDWYDFLDDPKWLNKAMLNTFGRLKVEDKELVRPLYEDWLWYVEHFDLEALVGLGFIAEMVLLDRNKNRVCFEGRYQTVLVSLHGASKEEALCQLNRDCYEFLRWCC